MLDNTDKKWLVETIDEKLGGTKTELRAEMQGMKKELTDEFDAKLQTLKIELTDKMDEMKTDIAEEVSKEVSRHVMVVFENTYQQYVQVIGENIPDLMRAFNNIRKQQERHEASIELLNNIVKDLDHRVTVLEHTAG